MILSFIDAYNRGDQGSLQTFFAAGPDLLFIFSAPNPPPRGFFAAGDVTQPSRGPAPPPRDPARELAALLDYFAERHADGEVLRLAALGLIYSGERVGFDFTIERRANAMAAATVLGKGERSCATHKIHVWNIGAA